MSNVEVKASLLVRNSIFTCSKFDIPFFDILRFPMRTLLLLATVFTVGLPSFVRAQDAKHEVKMDEDTKKATARALEFLAGRQNADGSFTDGPYVHNTAITAYTMLAFMSQGHVP